MKLSSLFVFLCSIFFLTGEALAVTHPAGEISFYNSSQNKVTAKVSAIGKFSLDAKQGKNVPYSTLSQACSATPTHCTAQFYVNNNPAGSATINVVTGKLISMNLQMKVRTAKGPQQVLRSVVIH